MGVQGFSLFIKKKTPRVGVNFDLLEEAKRKKILIGIDGSSFMFHVVNQISRMNSLLLFREYVIEFFNLLQVNSIECCVFLDGFNKKDKENEHEKRHIQRTELNRKSADEAISDIDNRSISHYPFPHPLFSKEFSIILKSLPSVTTIVSKFEADIDLAQWALDNSSSNGSTTQQQIIGVLSNDSDYFFYDMNCFYFPLDQMSFKPPYSINFIGYTIDRISSSLQIKKSKLPFLATLIGNDQTKHFQPNRKLRFKNNQDRVQFVTNLVKNQNCSNVSLIKEIFFISTVDLDTFNQSMKGYTLLPITSCNDDILVVLNDSKSSSKFRKSVICDGIDGDSNSLKDSLFSLSGHTSRIYNFTKLLHINEYTSHRHCFEPSQVPFSNSIINSTTILSSHFFGLLDSIENRGENSIINELITDQNQFKNHQYYPSYLFYSHQQCYGNQVSFNQRIFDFCKILNSTSYYNTLSNDNNNLIISNSFNFFNFYYIISWKFILSFKEFLINIEEWMIDSFLIHSLFLRNDIKIDFGLHNDIFHILYISEFYLTTLRWCLDISDAMAIPKTVNDADKLCPSHFFETTYIHPIWKMAKSNKHRISKQHQSTNDRLNILFKPIYHLITPTIITQFNFIKFEINKN